MSDQTALAAISLSVAVLALALSTLTAWLTLLRSGSVRMIQPSLFYLGPDGRSPAPSARPSLPKVSVVTLLYATAKRGRIIENMFVRVRRGQTDQDFNVWVYGAPTSLQRGGGLFVPDVGIATTHHFLLPSDGTTFQFIPGSYSVQVLALLVGETRARRLFSANLEIPRDSQLNATENDGGVFFDWAPDIGGYIASSGHRRRRDTSETSELLNSLDAALKTRPGTRGAELFAEERGPDAPA